MASSPLTIIAHMGACTELAENSIEALHRAASEAADFIEIDLRRSRDGTIVLSHDATTYRLYGSGGTVAQMDSSELRALRGPKGERIATLEDVLSLPLPVIHELKTPGFEAELVDAIADHRPLDIVSSFDHGCLDRIRMINPSVRIGYLWFQEDWRSAIETAARSGAHSVHPGNYEVCPELVDLAKSFGLAVHVWSVGDAARALQLKAWGVDGIMTYSPAATRAAIETAANNI